MALRLVLALALLAGTVAQVTLPDELYANLDPIDAVELAESSRDIDATESRAIAAMEQDDRDQRLMNPSTNEAPDETDSTESFDDSRHDQQMDDLFGDMLHQQSELEVQQRANAVSQERFEARASDGGDDSRLDGEARNDLGESMSEHESEEDDLGRTKRTSGTASRAKSPASTKKYTASNAKNVENTNDGTPETETPEDAGTPDTETPVPVDPGTPDTETPEDAPGKEELQSFGTGHVTNEVQVGSNDGKLGAVHGFTQDAGSNGRMMLFGKHSGLYLQRQAGTWSIFSDVDEQSNGVCLMTAYNNERAGLKICHSSKKDGDWASGNVGITGNLLIKSKDATMDVERLHLTDSGISETGFVLRVGSAQGGPTISAGVSTKSAWLQTSDGKPLVLNAAAGNVGIATTSPEDKLHVNGDAIFNKVFLGTEKATLEENKLTFKNGTGWEMRDKEWLQVIGNKGIKAAAGAFFDGKVGVNFNWKTTPSDAKMRINDGKIAVTRNFGGNTKGLAYFYDDNLAEGRIEARDFTAKQFAGLNMEAEAVIFNPDGKNPIAFGTREPKEGYLVHIEGNNKIDGHIYVAKKMKVSQKSHVSNLHIPRLNVKDDKGTNAAGQEPADIVKDFVIGEYIKDEEGYSMKEGGTNLRMGYSSNYCWIQMWPKGPGGAPLVMNAAGNSVGFGTTRPLTNIPGSGSSVKMHVDGNMLVTGNLIVTGKLSGGEQALMHDTETLLDISRSAKSAKMLHDIDVDVHDDGQMRFSGTERHSEAISLSHVAAVLTNSLKHHQAELDESHKMLEQSGTTLDKLLTMAKI